MAADLQGKIVNIEGLLHGLDRSRAAGKTIVQCHGCFDIVHPGHIRYLEFARQQGDVLVVTITGDSDVGKGADRPYIPQELRAENLAALMFVDFVCVTAQPTASEVLGQVKPDVYVKGREYENSTDPAFLTEKRVVETHGGRMIFSSGETVFSSTKLIERLPQSADFDAHKLALFCTRHEIANDPLTTMVERFRGMRVLIVGDIVLDRYVTCDAYGVASEAPVLSLIERDQRRFVGGAAIVARHVQALGAQAFLLSSAAGDADADTTMVRALLDREGVEAHLMESRPNLVEKTRFLADDTKVLKVDRAHCCPLDSISERHAAQVLEQQSRLADAVIFCDFGYGTITGSLLARVLPSLRQNVRTLTADVSSGCANLLHFNHADLLCPTEREVRAMLNDYESGLSAVAWQLLEQTSARHLFVTLEKRGMVVFERQSQDRQSFEWSGRLKSDQLPSFADRIMDRLGCGDALLAAATLALASGASVHQAAYAGNAAAAIEIATVGNLPVSSGALLTWFGSRPELSPASTRPQGVFGERKSVTRSALGGPVQPRKGASHSGSNQRDSHSGIAEIQDH